MPLRSRRETVATTACSLALVTTLLSSCALDAGADGTAFKPDQVPAREASARWQRLNLGSRAAHRLTVRTDEYGNVIHGCKGAPTSAEPSRP